MIHIQITNLKDLLVLILTHYLSIKTKKFNHKTYEKLFLRTNTLRDHKEDLFHRSIGNLNVDCSAGNGNWAYVPWIRIYNKSIAPSPEKGLYLVYLFSNQMNHVYLSLAEGVTDFNNSHGRQKLISLIDFSNNLNNKVHDFINNNKSLLRAIKANKTNLRLTDKKATLLDTPVHSPRLPKEYSAGGVLNIKYSLFTLKKMTNDQLLNDLNIMCRIYDEILNMEESTAVHHYTKQVKIKNKYNFINIPLTKINPANKKSTKPFTRKLQSNTNKKPNYLKQTEKNSREGNGGELRVKKYEQDRLKKLGRNDLAAKVTQESKYNDRKGYDILSFTSNGDPLYIEVKTTPNKNGNTSFPMSWREISVANKYPKNFRLYRVYNAKKHHKSSNDHLWLNVYTHKDLVNMLKKVESYIVYPNRKGYHFMNH